MAVNKITQQPYINRWKCHVIDLFRDIIIWLPKGKKSILNILNKILNSDDHFVGRIKNIPMAIDTNDWNGIFNIYVTNGRYEEEVMGQIEKILNPGCIFMDIGANKGFFTVIARQCVGESGLVYAYEPVQVNYSDIDKTIRINGWKNVKLEQKAISDKNGDGNLNIIGLDQGNFGWSYLSEKPAKKSVIVQTATLDYEFDRNNINHVDLLKMDIEGGELSAIQGAKNILKEKKIKSLLIEIHIGVLGQEMSMQLINEICKFGYDVKFIGKDFHTNNKNYSSINPQQLLSGNRVHVLFKDLNQNA